MSDSTGSYRFENLLPGIYRITFSGIGYVNYNSEQLRVSGSDSIFYPVIMQRSTGRELELVTVTGKKISLNISPIRL